MRKTVILVGALFLMAISLGCIGWLADSEPTPIPTDTPAPTATTTPPMTREEIMALIGRMNTPVPIPLQPTLQPIGNPNADENGQENQAGSNPDQTPEETAALAPAATPLPTVVVEPTVTLVPTATPRPTATPVWRPAPRPQGAAGYAGFDITGGPSISNGVLSITAIIDGHTIVPSEVQVWQSLRRNDDSGRCPTHKPIALITDSAAGGSSAMQWSFCSQDGTRPLSQVDSVPWVTGSWSYSERSRRRTTEPLLADWSLNVSLINDDVESLEYANPEGYYIVIFAGDLLLARTWVDY